MIHCVVWRSIARLLLESETDETPHETPHEAKRRRRLGARPRKASGMLRKTTVESQCQMKKRYGLFQCPLYRHGGFLFGWMSAISSTISPQLVKSQILRVSKK